MEHGVDNETSGSTIQVGQQKISHTYHTKQIQDRKTTNQGLQTWNDLLKIFILDVLSLIAYSPSDDQTNSNADPNDLFLQARAV